MISRPKRFLINCTGCWIGDILFASSIAERLHIQTPGCKVDYFIPLPQPKYLLETNPYIENVTLEDATRWLKYDRIIEIPPVDQSIPATVQMQIAAGIKNWSLDYKVYTIPQYDEYANLSIYSDFHKRFNLEPVVKYKNEYTGHGKIINIAWQRNWEWKAYQTTQERLDRREGGPHRNIDNIIYELSKYELINLIPVGFDRHVNQYDSVAQDPELYAFTASLIKACDWFIGSEGGLSNLAAGVGTKCIITTDFIFQNYGPQGFVRPCAYPMMGPAIYFPDAGHVHLDPFISDEDIPKVILDTIF